MISNSFETRNLRDYDLSPSLGKHSQAQGSGPRASMR